MIKDLEVLSEKRIKQILNDFLVSQGWNPQIDWGPAHGIDIEARRGTMRWIIEVKVSEPQDEKVVDAFVSVLGEILQRMDDTRIKYSIALPDTEPFRRLWKRLPALAKNRIRITALFVNPSGNVVQRTI
jgi:hypothetical protein